MAEKKDVVLQISTDEGPFLPSQERKDGKASSFPSEPQLASSPTYSNPELMAFEKLRVSVSPDSSEQLKPTSSSPSTMKPPRVPTPDTMTRRPSLARSEFSKPKSRFVEPPYPNDAHLKEEKYKLVDSSSPQGMRSPNYMASPKNNVSSSSRKENLKSVPVTPKTPLIGAQDEDEDEEVYKTAILKVSSLRGKKLKPLFIIELIVSACLLAVLISSLLVKKLENTSIWGLELWKWCVLLFVIFCGRLVTGWFMNVLVFLIERNFLLKKKVLYFVYGLKKSFQAFIWVALILLAWGFLFTSGVKRSRHTTKILHKVTRSLAAFLIGTAIWLVKSFLIKLLASSFHVTRFFDRIQESIFHQYVVRTLSGPPLLENGATTIGSNTAASGHLSFRTPERQNEERKEESIDVDKLKKISNGKVSAWTMKGLMNAVTGTGLTTLSNSFDQDDEDDEKKDTEITSEWQAKAAAYKIFNNVAKPGSKYIEEEDLLRFMKWEEINNVMALFEGAAETRKIKRSSLKNWLVNVYNERKALAHSLNDSKTAIEELNKLVSVIVFVLISIVWLFMMGYLTTNILVFISSQLLLVAFIFGNTAKTVFEAIIFVFVMHPFDVGDRCVIDGVTMVVEEMNILTTIFLRYDNEKISYPNTVLATKPISNFYRSPEMGDAVEFCIDVSTSMETIVHMKAQIKTYLESKPQHWRTSHSLQVKEIENVNKMKMGLYVNHTINFQHGDRGNRRSDLMLELKRIFENLGVKYHLLPQEVHLLNVHPPSRR